MQPVSVVIPYRSDNGGYRDERMAWIMRRYKALLPEPSEVVVGLESHREKFFRRAEAINNGVRQSKHDIILIADADAVYYQDALEVGVTRLEEGAPWVIPYHYYHELDKQSTFLILHRDPALDPFSVAIPSRSYPSSNASLTLVYKDAFWKTGGFDERFIAWGPEDQAWVCAATTFLGEPARVSTQDMLHLWHPIKKGYRTDNPHYGTAMELWDKYQDAQGDIEMMRKVLS